MMYRSRIRPGLIAILVGMVFAVPLLVPSVSEAQGSAKEKSAGKPKTPPRGKEAAVVPGVHDYSSKNILLHTDMPPDEAKELLTRLENMLVLVSAYFQKPNAQVIEMNVVKQQANWPPNSIHTMPWRASRPKRELH